MHEGHIEEGLFLRLLGFISLRRNGFLGKSERQWIGSISQGRIPENIAGKLIQKDNLSQASFK